MKRIYSLRDVARELGMAYPTLYRRWRDGLMVNACEPACEDGKRRPYWDERGVQAIAVRWEAPAWDPLRGALDRG